MGATGLDFQSDPSQRAHYFRAKAEEFREQACGATLNSVRESYLKMARTSDIRAASTERIFRSVPESQLGGAVPERERTHQHGL